MITATTVSIVGGSAPYQEAIKERLRAAGLTAVDSDGDVLVICCTTEAHWNQAASSALWAPTVAVLPDLDLDAYVRALALGAGAVHVDTPTNVIVDVVTAVIAGEALLPLAITQALASHQPPSSEQITATALQGIEQQIANGLRDGLKIDQIATNLNYSDRTIRRKLQGIYLKLGADNRNQAIEILRSQSDQ